ncbi:hypothetical protein INT45_008471 [Circinella minor]|uniref:Uncharacterized protein n=1 Tax=Circinella minor TaxID=1195481 RepID=A0A8H7VQ45_9FUNG|nr:hypothetical protein INT45_008471 [Circinella minor]
MDEYVYALEIDDYCRPIIVLYGYNDYYLVSLCFLLLEVSAEVSVIVVVDDDFVAGDGTEALGFLVRFNLHRRRRRRRRRRRLLLLLLHKQLDLHHIIYPHIDHDLVLLFLFDVADVSYNRKLLELMQDRWMLLRFVGIGLAVVVVRYNHKLVILVLSLMKHFVQSCSLYFVDKN